MSHRSRRREALALSLMLLPACQATTSPSTRAQVALAQNESRWIASGMTDYSYELATNSAWFSDSVRIVVSRGVVTSAVSLRTPAGNATGVTIVELFARVRSAIDAGSPVSVRYDPGDGHPVSIIAPDPPNVADFGWSARVSHLARLQ